MLVKCEVQVLMSDLFGVDGTQPLNGLELPAPYAARIASLRRLLDELAGIGETVLIYPSTGGRPKARRMLTETTATQDQLTGIFGLDRWAPVLRS